MIIRKNMSSEDVQKQVASTAKFQRGFNQTPKSMNDNFNKCDAKNNPNNMPDMDLNKKMQALKNANRLKWK